MTRLPQVGQRIEVDGKGYWIAKIIGPTLEVMPESLYDKPTQPNEKQGGFWSTFFVIVLVVVLMKLIF